MGHAYYVSETHLVSLKAFLNGNFNAFGDVRAFYREPHLPILNRDLNLH